jgi:DNA polymerase-3 subunit epsilon
MPSRFLAIDFETANYQSDSACSIGLVRVHDNVIVEQEHFFIQPPYKNFVFTSLHGISWKTVEDAPLFSELWPKLKPLFKGVDFLIAHNASFDRKVLNSCCDRYGIEAPKIDFKCTVQLARKNLGIYPTNLPAVCKVLQIPLKHHDAISDALACAKIAIASFEALKKSPEAFEMPATF